MARRPLLFLGVEKPLSVLVQGGGIAGGLSQVHLFIDTLFSCIELGLIEGDLVSQSSLDAWFLVSLGVLLKYYRFTFTVRCFGGASLGALCPAMGVKHFCVYFRPLVVRV